MSVCCFVDCNGKFVWLQPSSTGMRMDTYCSSTKWHIHLDMHWFLYYTRSPQLVRSSLPISQANNDNPLDPCCYAFVFPCITFPVLFNSNSCQFSFQKSLKLKNIKKCYSCYSTHSTKPNSLKLGLRLLVGQVLYYELVTLVSV